MGFDDPRSMSMTIQLIIGKARLYIQGRERLGIRHGDFLNQHSLGETIAGEKFVYCPEGRITSWHPDDYKNRYCAFCKKFFVEIWKGDEK